MKKCILSLFLFFASGNLIAQNIQSLELLKKHIEQYVHQQLAANQEGKIQVQVGNIDSQIRLKACAPELLEVFNPYKSNVLNTNTLGIKCLEPENRWSLYVPLSIHVSKTVFVSQRTLNKGEKISAHDIYPMEMNVNLLRNGYFSDIDKLIGLVCKQRIGANQAISPQQMELAKIIQKGEKVNIVTQNNNLTISMEGIAMHEAALGDSIKVKNLSSNKILEGQATGRKNVSVIF